jgi:putative hydrolase of the HAD superfamily
MTTPTAILFDMDDTLLAFDAVAAPCWQRVCERYAPRIEGLGAETLLQAIRAGSTQYWRDPGRHRQGRLCIEQARRNIVAGALLGLNINQPELAYEIADTFSVERVEQIYPFPGAIETLRQLRERGSRLGLLTNGDQAGQRKKIDRFALGPLFDCILIEGELGFGKPDERVYLRALADLKAQPAETVMVGDNLEWDVAGPQRLGIKGVWVDHAGQGLPQDCQVRPFRIIQAVTELLFSLDTPGGS